MSQASQKLIDFEPKPPSLRLIRNAETPTNTFSQAIESSLLFYDNNNERSFNFSEFAPLGFRFAESIGKTFIFYSSTVALDTAQAAYSAILRFFRCGLLTIPKKPPELTLALKYEHEKATITDWENALAYWREDLLDEKQIGPVRKRNLICGVQTFFKYLISRGAVPKIYFSRIPADLRNGGRPTKCLAEAVQRDTSSKQLKEVDKHLTNIKD